MNIDRGREGGDLGNERGRKERQMNKIAFERLAHKYRLRNKLITINLLILLLPCLVFFLLVNIGFFPPVEVEHRVHFCYKTKRVGNSVQK